MKKLLWERSHTDKGNEKRQNMFKKIHQLIHFCNLFLSLKCPKTNAKKKYKHTTWKWFWEELRTWETQTIFFIPFWAPKERESWHECHKKIIGWKLDENTLGKERNSIHLGVNWFVGSDKLSCRIRISGPLHETLPILSNLTASRKNLVKRFNRPIAMIVCSYEDRTCFRRHSKHPALFV